MEARYGAHAAPQIGGRPTGFRKMTFGLLAADRAAGAFAGLPEGVTTPGQVLAAFKAAAPRLGISVRLVHAVDWLFRFTQVQDWDAGSRPIAWPSAETQRSALSLAVTQAKAINRQLINHGLLTMRDSPNGKRYGKRDRQGRIVEAYGFDLAPLAQRYAEFVHVAEEDRLERELLGKLRRRLTVARKAVAQLIETAREYGHGGGEWTQLEVETRQLVAGMKGVECPDSLEWGVRSLERRQHAAHERLEILLKVVNSDPTQPENRPHNTTTNEQANLSDTVMARRKGSISPLTGVSPSRTPVRSEPTESELKLAPDELVLLAPRLRGFLHGPDPTWRDVVDAADWLRDELGISKPLWGEACLILGREWAAVAVGIVSTKDPGHFKTTPGGYFHGMLNKARSQTLNLDRTIWALRGARTPAGGGRPGKGAADARSRT